MAEPVHPIKISAAQEQEKDKNVGRNMRNLQKVSTLIKLHQRRTGQCGQDWALMLLVKKSDVVVEVHILALLFCCNIKLFKMV